ncbi:hypothetical protein DXG03_001314 [Asterophora parasitica]|uniref:Ecl1 n=1 Tax=Asterophora parasitica TaxID=117018 RepID=A0A9P7KBU5_9AGAR|nr:hypothetical protein DXG03_001314 [Asterophora parasitica]
MFEEICLVCGKQLIDDNLAYCSENCQSLDTSSPSVSSASSAVSSPNLGYATGGDVPALIPSALGSALGKFTRPRHHYSVSSSSASSTSWSAVTDDEDDVYLGISSYRSNHFADSSDSFYEGSSKSANFLDSMQPSALSYARRPSGTNNRATVNPHARASSYNVHDIPRSAPLHSHLSSTDDDGGYSDVGFSSRDESESEFQHPKPASPLPKSKRNRASLPACFSLLQMSLAEGKHISPVSSSGNTIARPSPPTPKLPLAGLTHTPSITSIHTPRGRRRAPGNSRSSRGDSSSRSHSRSRSRRVALPQFSPRPFRRDESPSRGHATGRRDSSPPLIMKLSTEALEDHNRLLTAAATKAGAPGLRKGRGRATAEVDVDAPGYGHGRSGLLDRERALGLGNRPSRVL